ncbi:hypothetical protein FJV41_49040 [Myxococcus llanfairpwllgwyngyllgogerychwyrndrobwllllantysiliogogogochensis]|uniref:Uncharacterized protein n=1 Tax=Myxococcus llanfairpwllgwyngyllgogerychwyrndrobwllllantysiliogogogochensis TaxID=2590453 RepID=A0A540WI00_9BACT|nr:hypothetical protein [Myxococcus llanfairpwllgwyngyllgogerychwyrndrobwllllantysiliogogogochensis]TQF08603.1 hypothetical protein FJV41_49040 [Myxococcus llanfairpwllgwyngyllgogerychwyrndrobwllllantysiliogogogochensis]
MQGPTGMPTRDEFVTAPGKGPNILPLDIPPLAQQHAQQVSDAYRTGGAKAATTKLQELVQAQPALDTAYVNELIRMTQPTLQQVGAELGVRVSKDKDDSKKNGITRDSLNALAAVAERAGPEGQQALGKALADGLPNSGQLNQFDDVLQDMKTKNPIGAVLLGGATVTELQASGKDKAAKELQREHKPLDYQGQWKPGQKLSEANNAHSTNTQHDFNKAVEEGKNWVEGDLQTKKDGGMEMNHDESGPKLSFQEWLAKGKALGVGVKVDVKLDAFKNDPVKKEAAVKEMVKQVVDSGIPGERLMFSVNPTEARWIREALGDKLPNATMGINAPDGALTSDTAAAMQQHITDNAPRPVSFITRYKDIKDASPEVIQALKNGKATVSVWNDPGDMSPLIEQADDVVSETKKLKERGVDGMIDIRESTTLAITGGKLKDTAGDVKDSVVSSFKGAVSFGKWK